MFLSPRFLVIPALCTLLCGPRAAEAQKDDAAATGPPWLTAFPNKAIVDDGRHWLADEDIRVDQVFVSSTPVPTQTTRASSGRTVQAAGCGGKFFGGPEGGLLRTIVEHPNDPETLYLGSFLGGVQRSFDGGQHWQAANAGLFQSDARAVLVHPADPNLVLTAGFAGGPYRSADGGATWQPSGNGATLSSGFGFVVDPDDPAHLYYLSAAVGQLFESTDWGVNWSAISFPGDGWATSLLLQPDDPQIMLLGTSRGLLRSPNGGGLWQWIHEDFDLEGLQFIVDLKRDPHNPARIYLAFAWYAVQADGGLYRSEDHGLNWTPANDGLPIKVSFNHNSLAVDPHQPGVLYAAAEEAGIYKSIDGAMSWSEASQGLPEFPRRMTTVVTSAVEGRVYAADGEPGRGFYVSHDSGGSWQRSTNGLYADSASALQGHPSEQELLYGGRGAVHRFRAGQWERLCADTLPDSARIDRAYASIGSVPGTMYLGHTVRLHSGVFVSLDDGQTCEARPNDNHWTRALSADSDEPQRVYTASFQDGAFYSPDAGLTWEPRSFGITNLNGRAMLVADYPWVYYGSGGGGVFRSNSGGERWEDANSGLGDSTNVRQLTRAPHDEDHLYAVRVSGSTLNVYQSFNGGTSWDNTSTGLGPRPLDKLAVAPNDPNVVVGIAPYLIPLSGQPAETAIYLSLDGGMTWNTLASDALYRNVAVMPTTPPMVVAEIVGGGVLEIPIDCIPLIIVSSDPPHGAVDARQPFDINGGPAQGWDAIRLKFSGPTSGLTVEDFELEVSSGVRPLISAVEPEGNDILVSLSAPIPSGACTTLRHVASGAAVQLGALPADVNNDLTSGPLDILAAIDCLNAVTSCELWQCDANRSQVCEPADILRVIDLLNGAGAYKKWVGTSLPDCP